MNEQMKNGDCSIEEIEVRFFDPEDEKGIDVTIKVYAYLMASGIPTKHYKKVEYPNVEVQKLETIKVDFEFRRIATGDYAKEHDLPNGAILRDLSIELVSADQDTMYNANIKDSGEFATMLEMAEKTFELLVDYSDQFNLFVVSAIIWFAKDESGKIYLASDINPEMIEFWDKKTNGPFSNNDEIYLRILEGK